MPTSLAQRDVVAAAAEQVQMRERPLADAAGSRASLRWSSAPGSIWPRDRARDARERARLRGSEAGGLERGGVGELRGRRARTTGPCGWRAPWRRVNAQAMLPAALRVDQLLDDRPGERLERLRLAQHAQLRARLDDAAEQRVVAVRAVERLEVVVEREHEAHAGDRLARAVLGRGVRAQEDVVAAPRRLGERELAVDPHRPPRDAASI